MSLENQLTQVVSEAFKSAGYESKYGEVFYSQRPELGQFQCNGALAAAKEYKKNPIEIAGDVMAILKENSIFKDVSCINPGFINITLTDQFLLSEIARLSHSENYGTVASDKLSVVIDYGGANVAKPLHVGHLRAAIIGESLKRISNYIGHKTLGDVHLGDWGLQMGQLIVEIKRMYPTLPYFDPEFKGEYPKESPVTIDELSEIYPIASARCKEDEEVREASKQATFELQEGRPGYKALWKHFCDISIKELKRDYGDLNVHFDLWLGESDAHSSIDILVKKFKEDGILKESDGALIINVSNPDDKKELPPLILIKSDGAVMYGSTDLATIYQRVKEYNPDLILYVVDDRQSDHFRQVFKAARIGKVVPDSLDLEHVNFGTMNGTDGKPFKTRAGGVLRLRSLLDTIEEAATKKMKDASVGSDYSDNEQKEISRMVGVAALKFADLSNHYTTNYIFDIDRFVSFEGKTGPYLLYTSTRIKSILKKADIKDITVDLITDPKSDIERNLLLMIAKFPYIITKTFEQRAPNHLCEYTYELASLFNQFYANNHILGEKDSLQQKSWLALLQLSNDILETSLDLLGIETPERM